MQLEGRGLEIGRGDIVRIFSFLMLFDDAYDGLFPYGTCWEGHKRLGLRSADGLTGEI